MTTRYPLCAILCELAAQTHRRNIDLRLSWIPREQNLEADALSNLQTESFSKSLRVAVNPLEMNWIVLDDLLALGAELYAEVAEARQKKKEKVEAPMRKRKLDERLKVTDPW